MRQFRNVAPRTLPELLAFCRSQASGCMEWQRCRDTKGYGRQRWGKRSVQVHRLVMHLAADFDLKSKFMILHKCDNPPCCNPVHLYVGTEADNTRDKMRSMRHNYGSKVPLAKLTDEAIVELFKQRKAGLTTLELAEQFNLTDRNVRTILARKTWRHVYIPKELL